MSAKLLTQISVTLLLRLQTEAQPIILASIVRMQQQREDPNKPDWWDVERKLTDFSALRAQQCATGSPTVEDRPGFNVGHTGSVQGKTLRGELRNQAADRVEVQFPAFDRGPQATPTDTRLGRANRTAVKQTTPRWRNSDVDNDLTSGTDLKQEREAAHSLRGWNATIFQAVPQLQYLGIGYNELDYTSSTHLVKLGNLTKLNLEHNILKDLPKTCYCQKPIYPELEELNLNFNRINRLTKDICLPKLKLLDLSWNPIRNIMAGMFGSKFPSLFCLFLESLVGPLTQIQALAFNNTSLRYLSLMYNNLNFLRQEIHTDGFRGLPRLETIQLEHNYLSNERFLQQFRSADTLTRLYMGNANLDEITLDTFQPFPNLINITLHRNHFTSLPDGVFDNLDKLKRVDLSNSRITNIGEKTFSAATRNRLEHLDLSGNHFACDCDLLWFRAWLASNASVFWNSYSHYRCANKDDSAVLSFYINQQECLLSRAAATFIVVVVLMLLVVGMVGAAFYRYRWTVRLVLYEAFRGANIRLQLPAKSFRYDVFVSYAAQDLPWVRRHLLPHLENSLKLRLCIHQRDFLPGENIVDNIFNSVEASRKILMLFSRSFARSQWCQFELALCLTHVLKYHDALVLACLDDVTSDGSDLITPTMMAVLHTTTYIQWAEGQDAGRAFWGRIRIAFGEILPPPPRRKRTGREARSGFQTRTALAQSKAASNSQKGVEQNKQEPEPHEIDAKDEVLIGV